eukprot:8658135-Alexandrium_andersonii.AAC.1
MELGSAIQCHQCHGWLHTRCMFRCPKDECGHNYCEPCSVDHVCDSRPPTPRLDLGRYRRPEGEEEEAAAA